MSVASVNEISAVSPEGFEAAIREALDRANKTLRNIQGAWVKDMNVLIEDGNITGYKVNLEVTFVLEDGAYQRGTARLQEEGPEHIILALPSVLIHPSDP